MMEKKTQTKMHKAIFILILACLAAMAVIIFVEGPRLVTEKVSGLTVTQNQSNINIIWNEMDCDGYDLTISCDGNQTIVPTDESHYTLSDIQLEKTYIVTVSARLKSGGNSRDAREKITTTKLKQQTKLNLRRFSGFAGDTFRIKASGTGDITYSSADEKIATVNKKGLVTLKTSGYAPIIVSFSGDAIYDETHQNVDVNVYPEVLNRPTGLSVSNKSHTRAVLSWQSVDFADRYILLKKSAATGKYRKIGETDDNGICAEVTREDGKYAIRAVAELNEKKIRSPVSLSVNIKSTANSAKSYPSSRNIRVLDSSNLKLFREIHGDGDTNIPQSMSITDNCYVVSYVNRSGTSGKLISYRKSDGECVSIDLCSGMGHANGATYNPNTNRFYIAKTHESIRTASCSTYHGTTKAATGSFDLPRVTSGIAYDESNDKFYLSKGNEIYVCSSNFKVEKFIHKFVRYNHAQDIGAYNGLILVCTWVNGSTSYIDIYRSSDGAYLGSYDVSLGEIESCVVNDGYLVILMNTLGTNKDRLYISKKRIAIP